MKLVYTFLLSIICLGTYAQDNFNLELVSEVVLNEEGNDIWGYVAPDGTEYAILGSRTSTKIYSLVDPAAPVLVESIPGPASVWRDMKDWNDHIYVTTDQNGTTEGLVIIDMTQAPATVTATKWQPFIDFTDANNQNITGQLNTCHNIYIDENGIAYLAGCGGVGRGGVIMLDLNQDPKNPVVLGIENEDYAHDAYVRGDTLYASEINTPGHLSIYDVSDKTNPVRLATEETSFSFCHNTWISDDGNYAFTTDELANAFVDSYDISDMDDIKRLDQFQPLETADRGVIPHNTHYKDGYLITSWYTDGVVITDVSNPDIMVKVGGYDSYLGADGGFNGCWGAYPWLPSGLILASNLNGANQGGSLLVLQPDYQRASFLRGTVTDVSSGSPINNVDVSIASTQMNEAATNGLGVYGTGIGESGTFDVTFTHPDYFPVTVSASLESGETTILDVQLEKFATYRIEGITVEATDGTAIPNCQVLVVNEDRTLNFMTDLNGEFSEEIINGTYDIYVGKWGYLHASFENLEIQEDVFLTVEKEIGYQDDFILDLGWEASSTNTETGFWVREVPVGTPFGNQTANPGVDIVGDLGDMCYITGNGGGGAGTDDIDSEEGLDGEVVLISDVMDLTTYTEPFVNYSTWFFNDGGNGVLNPNDTLAIYITNGIQTFNLEKITQSQGAWRDQSSFKLSDFITITNTMQLQVISGDYQVGHVVECGFDQFIVTEGAPSSITDIEGLNYFSVRPNPFNDFLEIVIDSDNNSELEIKMVNLHGQVLMTSRNIENGVNTIDVSSYPSGVYFLHLNDGVSTSYRKLIKQ